MNIEGLHLLAEALRQLRPEFQRQLAQELTTMAKKKNGNKKADKAAVRAAAKRQKVVARFDKKIAKLDKRIDKMMEKRGKLEAKRDLGGGKTVTKKPNGKSKK